MIEIPYSAKQERRKGLITLLANSELDIF